MNSAPGALLACLAAAGMAASHAGLSVAHVGGEPASAGTITYEEIVAEYADSDSRFVVLEGNDGINVHYKDQGSGPAVLLVHSSTGDLKDWAGWVDILGDDYRIVRFDLPAFGLTGPVPSGNYSIDRFLTLVDSLMDHLDIDRFAIAGASYGGLVAFRYAGTRTDRVTALILLNSAGIEYGGRGGTRERVLARVLAPALVMWGGASRALSPETAQAFVDAMKSAKSTEKIIFDGGGHFLHISKPQATGGAVKEFLDRKIAASDR